MGILIRRQQSLHWLKGSARRKRYILIRSDVGSGILDRVRSETYARFRSKEKFRDGSFLIVLADQFNKAEVISYINRMEGVRTVLSSGSIKKLKKVIADLDTNASSLSEESSLFLGEGK